MTGNDMGNRKIPLLPLWKKVHSVDWSWWPQMAQISEKFEQDVLHMDAQIKWIWLQCSSETRNWEWRCWWTFKISSLPYFLYLRADQELVKTAQVPEELTKSEEAKLKRQAKNYRLAGNALLIKNREEWFLFPSPEERSVLIKQYQERAHQSASTVFKNLKLRYYWPKMDSEVAEIISKCLCFRGKSRVPTKTTLKFPQLPWKPFSHIEMDLVGELPVTIYDYRWVLVVQDYLTKYVLMFPMASKDALTIAAFLVHQVFYRFGFPKKIQSD